MFAAQRVLESANRERDTIEAGLRDTNRALIAALDRDFQSNIAALNALAASKLLDTGNFHEFYELCQRTLPTQPGWNNVLLHDPAGNAILNLQVPFGGVVPRPADPKTIEAVVRTKKPAVVELIKGRIVGWKIGVRVPIVRAGEVKYVLSAFIEPRRVAAILDEQKIPRSWVGVIYDQKLNVVARSRDGDKLIGQKGGRVIGSEPPQANEGLLRGYNREGVLSYSSFRRSAFSGFHVLMNVPAELLDGPVRRSLLTGVGVALAALLFGFLLATVMAKRITDSVAALKTLAHALGHKKKLRGIQQSPIAELDGITQALYDASDLLQASEAKQLKAEDELRRANDELEQRVRERTAALHEESRNKQKLEDSLRSQALLLQLTHEAIIVRSVEDAKIQFWNKGASEIYGWSADEAVGEGIHNLLHCRCAQPLKEIHDKLFHDDRWEGEVFHTRKDGTELILESRWSVQRDADGLPVYILEVNSDVTSRKYAEQKSQENEWLARVGTMTSIFAHEIANPLNSISTSMELIEMDLEAPVEVNPRVKKTLEISTREIQRVSALLSEFRAFARPQAANLKPTDLVELLRDVLVPQAAVCQSVGITIRRELRDLPPIPIDPDKIKQVILNLYKNAIEAMPDGGILTVRLHQEKDAAVLEISDTGIGIPKGLDVFQLFKTTKPNGTGLGLPVVRQIIAAHRGSVEYTSVPGQGTTFRVCLRVRPAIELRANTGGDSGGVHRFAEPIISGQKVEAERSADGKQADCISERAESTVDAE
jgi:PAS domain S-box-containing protein